MAVELWIKPNGATEYSRIAVKDGTEVEITKAIDIDSQVNNLTREWSKTITLLSTPTVNQLFSHIYDLRVYLAGTNFDPNKRSEALIAINGMPFFQGFAQLIEVRSDLHGPIEYDLACFGQSVNLLTKVENTKLRDLNWSDLDHVFDSGILSTWESGNVTMGSGYVYPMIDYKAKQSSPQTWELGDFYPAIFIKEIWDRTFELAGFSYQSNFINSDRFKSFIMPYAGKFESLEQADASGKVIQASRTTTAQTITPNASPSGSTKLIFNNEIQDPFGDYNNTTGAFTVSFLNPQAFVRFKNCTVTALESKAWGDVVVRVRLARKRSGVWEDMGAVADLRPTAMPNSFGFSFVGGTPYTLKLAGDITNQTDFNISFPILGAQANDEYYLFIGSITATPPTGSISVPSTTSFNFQLSIGSEITFYPPTGARVYGDNYRAKWGLPEEYKCGEFITDIVRLFNLVMIPDPLDETKILIEPYDDFFTDDIVDWSDKLHEGVPLKCKPLSMSTARSYLFSYADGNDYINKLHKSTYGRAFGYREKQTENQFTKDQKKIDVKFIPSITTRGANTDRYHISAYEGTTTFKPSPGLRILIYRPEVLTAQPYTVNFAGTSASFDFYAYAGTMDNVDNPTFDLNFGIPQAVYYALPGSITVTNNTVYTAYYSGKINQLTSRNSRTVEAVIKLNLSDVINLDFRKRYAFKGQTFRLLSVDGYKAGGDGLTPCKFINDDVVQSDAIVTAPAFGGSNTIGEEPSPGFAGDFDNPGIIDIGRNNNVAIETKQGLIIGDDNTVGAVGRFALINCNGVTVAAGLDDVTAINCNDITIDAGGTYIANKRQPKAETETFVLNNTTPNATASQGVVSFIVSTDETGCTLYIDPIPGAVYTVSYDHIDGSVLYIRDYNNIAVLEENQDGLYYFTFDGTTYTRLN